MPTKVEDDPLEKLEEEIRRLKKRSDRFFAGIQKRPPLQERRNIDVFIHELSKEKIRDNSRRFRFNQLITRYNQLLEMWGGRMGEGEEGPRNSRRGPAAMSGEPEFAPAPPPPPPEPRRV